MKTTKIVCRHFPVDSPMSRNGELCADCEHKQTIESLDNFTRGYLTCALWSSTDINENGDMGENLDANYGIEDFAPTALAQAIEDCKDFQSMNAYTLHEAYEVYSCNPSETPEEYAGHDFWLTRNGHGCGFWDRGLGELGRKLTDAAKVYGGVDLYVGGGGKVYQ